MSSIQWPFPSLVPALRERVSARVDRWARKRQGTDRSITQLKSKRIYILPTGVGLIFGLMTFAMLLGSMNYNNNLSFVLTFFLISLGFVGMHQCQRNLVGLEISFAGIEPVYAGQRADFKIAITNHSRSHRHHLQLYTGEVSSDIEDLAPGDSRVLHLEIPTHRRGRIALQRFGIRTLFPFELFRAWAWLHMDLEGLVYPKPADDAPEPPATETARGHRQHDARGEEDFAGLRRFHDGDSPRHVAWKAYARSQELLSKQFSGADTSSQWLDLDRMPGGDLETRLSILTHWIINAERAQRDYGLRIPGREFPPAHGGAHRHRCLAALALYGEPQDSGNG
ncbi:MAG: DUF58 domain-containing protein [Gammaproteobacteria bacterium]|nr:DUF58 domain-containing protein [Gammaproteobacteria bacterium]